jgi:Rad3-related DNA helicase
MDLKNVLKKGEFTNITGRKRLKDMYLFLKLWMKEHTSVARTVEEDRDGRIINLHLLDLQVMVRPILESFPSVFMFGDTLYPQGLYTRLLGLRPENTLNRSYITSEHLSRTSVVSMGNVETSYKHRGEDMWRSIKTNLERISGSTPGMVVSIFPSYFILDSVMETMADTSFRSPVLEETRGMSRSERTKLLDEIKLGGDMLVMCVQGGFLSRSIEEGTIRPDTIVMVGMHIPPPDPRSNQLKVHMQKKHGTNLGHVISVLLPALTRVMRVINTMSRIGGSGRNLVVLMDRRYQDARVLQSLPRFYDIKLLSGSNDYRGERYFRERD